VPELVRDGVNGWLVPAGDVAALADALAQALAAAPAELTQMGTAGAEIVRTRHDAMREGERLAGLFRTSAGTEPVVASDPPELEVAGGGGT
jgi:glycosyltransferase involved in cell wall biosynthesis